MQPKPYFDLPRAMLQVLALGVLIASSFWIFSPFLVPLAWASTMVVATWPLLLQVQSLYGGRRAPAVATMTLALLLLLVVPLAYGIDAVVGNVDEIVEWSKSLTTLTVPGPPGWLEALPLVGAKTAGTWREYAALSPEELAARLTPYAQGLAVWLVQQVGGFGMLVVNFLLTVVLCAVLYANGETAAGGMLAFARRLAGVQGEKAVHLAGQAVRGVALGVIVTAALQTALSGLGLVVAEVPFAAFLIALVFVLCIAQVGPSLVMLPVTIWVWSSSGSVWGAVFLVWSLACGLMDNFVRPVLIRRGADLPLLLIFSGVIGGLLAMGVIGLFLGPVVLAVAYTVLVDWVSEGDDPAPAADA
ncbi:MAG: AI-2E family transporter YdiK [Candidatus Binatia bacterium]